MAKMSWREACKLDPSLQSVTDSFASLPIHAQILTGGMTNRCWQVVCPQAAYVWRPNTSVTQAFGLSRYHEFQVLKAIETSQVGPKAITVNEQGLLVEWLEGESLTSGVPLDELVTTMANIHRLEVTRMPMARFDFTARVDLYWQQLTPEVKSGELAAWYTRWRNAPAMTADAKTEHVLCHCDLAGYNMVSTPLGIRVIDWEYAAIGDPRMDLALTIEATQQNWRAAVAHYCQLREIHAVDPWLEGVKTWLPRVRLMALLWYLLAYQLWSDETYHQQAAHLKALLRD